MEKYKLLIFPSAKQDLQDIIDYVNELSPDGAIKLYDEIVEKIGSLSQMSLRCPFVKNPLLKVKGYRVLVVNNYLLFFIVREKTVEIRRIIYGRRRYEFLF
ncbi:MAG: Plasmid stabilization system protein [Pelotomaculum sp. PtaB.Bin013]|uniref:Type II toxin-antitoxin system RelE/ParE family toxin n=1 Tax=Pelotomaculum isophthalicicum JI TaxID=947010 RepID=A0A9X4JV30_9FIRM|nr:type II toxin-antitoxin system RelE/ParE family toxin [Pelotomaculum isophthalicicum]MDF9406763.1 type II toxin-antitoxin system RelE/ParE family toxin [Pelotomaculum isophthalicicum JI]OPX89710.1 MAG: Plasmid stabilization system protein [Pelotomaculum sp. PtaB.Bin013]